MKNLPYPVRTAIRITGWFLLTALACWESVSAQKYAGVWWAPAQPGQGLTFYHEGNTLAGAWYLYDEAGEGLWVTFVAELSGTHLQADLLRFNGPPLGTVWDSTLIQEQRVGTVDLQFISTQLAEADFTLNNKSGSLLLERFDMTGQRLPEGVLGGVYWDPNQSGQGITLSHQDSTLAGAWYLYDTNGVGMWLTFVGTGVDPQATTATVDLLRFTGPALGTPWDDALIADNIVGNAAIAFGQAGVERVDYRIGNATGQLQLQRFSLAPPQCVDIGGIWQATETINTRCEADGESIADSVTESGAVTIEQIGCEISYQIPGFGLSRNGTVTGSRIDLTGAFILPLTDDVTITENVATIQGYVNGERIELSGTGVASGAISDIRFSCTGTSEALLTPGDEADFGPCLDQAGLYRGEFSETYCDGEAYRGPLTIAVTEQCDVIITTDGDATTGRLNGDTIRLHDPDDFECGRIDLDATLSGTTISGSYTYSAGGGGRFSASK